VRNEKIKYSCLIIILWNIIVRIGPGATVYWARRSFNERIPSMTVYWARKSFSE
jgi:hypothetical protein